MKKEWIKIIKIKDGFNILNFKKSLIILLFLFCIMGVCYAGNTSEHSYIPNEYYNDLSNVEVVYADMDGHFNIPFSDGSRGYCLEYMEEEAVKGDVFIVANTSFAVNNNTGHDVSNLLKVYFIDYDGYKDTDSVRVQHMIWHFTDDFDGWRVNKTLVNNIKETAEYKKLPDSDVIRYNITHNMGYRFNTFLSPYNHHQDYWGYDVWFELINSCCNGTVLNNYTNITNNNVFVNNTTVIENNYTNVTNLNFNISNDTYNNITNLNFNISNDTYNNITNIFNNITENHINISNKNISDNYIVNNYTNNTEIVIYNNTTKINIENITNISQDTYINNTTNNINNNYINQTNNTSNENNTYNNISNNNYTSFVNNQIDNTTNHTYYIIYIIKQNPLLQYIIGNIPQQNINILNHHNTGHDVIAVGILLIILFSGMLYTIIREHKK